MSVDMPDSLKVALEMVFKKGVNLGLEQAADILDVYLSPFPAIMENVGDDVKKELESQRRIITLLKEAILKLKDKGKQQ